MLYQMMTPQPTLPWLSLHFPVLPYANLSHPFSSFLWVASLIPLFVHAATAAKAASHSIVKRISRTACAYAFEKRFVRLKIGTAVWYTSTGTVTQHYLSKVS